MIQRLIGIGMTIPNGQNIQTRIRRTVEMVESDVQLFCDVYLCHEFILKYYKTKWFLFVFQIETNIIKLTKLFLTTMNTNGDMM